MIAANVPTDCEPQIRQSAKVQFGDHQASGMVAVTKKLGMAPRQLVEQVLAHLDLNGTASRAEITGLGFINIFLGPTSLAEHVQQALASDCFSVAMPEKQTTVVDYSVPNMAKEMHVGHLRPATIGGTAIRILELLGHKVIRTDHVGDRGTQFGILIAWSEEQQQENAGEMELTDLEGSYRDAKKHYDEDEEFAERVRNYMVKLQSGDEYFRETWRKLVDITMTQNQITYDRLNVTLTCDDVMGESLYSSVLPDIVMDLKTKGLIVGNEGAIIVFLGEFKNKGGEPMGVVTQKKDGGYLYTTTDVTCVKHRHEAPHADRVPYYIDSRQHQHLVQVWAIVRKAGYVSESVPLEHHMFSMMLDKDNRSSKTRADGIMKLTDLLGEALERTRRLVVEKNPDIPTDELEKLVNAVDIGAVKYADLSKNRATDYIFNWDNMLAFEGNIMSYMQYACTHVLFVFRKAKTDEEQLAAAPVIICEDREVQLAAHLLQFKETPTMVVREGTPHVVRAYLYGLVGLFSGFCEHCPILSAENEEARSNRLKLAQLAAKTLKLGLDTLGIETAEHI